MRVEVEILSQKAPGLRARFVRTAFVAECLDVTYYSIDHTQRAFKWRTVDETVILIDGTDVFTEGRVRLDAIPRDGKSALEICEAVTSGLSFGGEAE